MDRAETLRQALRKQQHARRVFQEAKTKEVAPDESPDEWSKRVDDLRREAEEADAEMARLRPEPPSSDDESETTYQPPIGPALSN